MKNLKKLSRHQQLSINGGLRQCQEDQPNWGCGDNNCCIAGACRPISQVGQNGVGYCIAQEQW